jgi:hypothetical protein
MKSLMGCLFLCLGLAARSEAQTFTLQAVADSSLKQSPANKNRGSDSTLELAGDGRVLARFDQAAIAAAVGSGRLVSASLELFVHATSGSWGPDGRPIEAHLVTAGWTEAGVTWNCAVDTNPANNKPDCATSWNGGTFADDATDSVVQTSTANVWVPFDVTADVAAFLGGTSNQGWLIVKADGDQSGKADYGSREGTVAEKPRLVLLVESAAHDQVPPVLAITSPSQPILVNDPAPAVVVEYSDGGSGVDLATLQVLVDGQDVTPSCASGPQSASCHASTLAAGNHTVQALLRDRAGNAAQASAAFQLLLGPGPHVVTLQTLGDTYLRNGDANKNFGAEPILRVRESGPQRALMQFDGASLASSLTGATMVSASLELHVEKNGRNWGKTGRTVDAHRLTAAWLETGATWNCPDDSNTTNGNPDCAAPWAGGSFAATPTASVLHTRDLTGWVRYDVTADVAAFATGSPDFGWLLKKTEETKSGLVEYDAREGTPGEGPRLVVVFTTLTAVDTTPPTVTITAPAEGSFVASSTPTVIATYSDAGLGVDPASVRLVLDGVDRSAEAQVTASGLIFTPTVPLADGNHSAVVRVKDLAGNPSQATRGFATDSVPPVITIVSPSGTDVLGTVLPPIIITYIDAISGVAPASLQVVLDGVSLPCVVGLASAQCQAPVLPEGIHSLIVRLSDIAGNSTTSEQGVRTVLDTTPPTISILSPMDGAFLAVTNPQVSASLADAGSGIDATTARLLVDDIDFTAEAAISATSLTWTPAEPLAETAHRVTVESMDHSGNKSAASISFIVDATPPVLTLDAPADGLRLNGTQVQVTGAAADENRGLRLEVNGQPVDATTGQFQVTLPLAEGTQAVTVRAVDAAGNTRQEIRQVTRFSLPTVAIAAPANLGYVAATTVRVSGTVSDPAATVAVNGVPAAVSGTSFTAADVPLLEGGNVLTATARDANGHIATDSVSVVRDLTPPVVVIHDPMDGARVFTSTLAVSGMVNDIVAGTVNAGEATVTVNGLPATVANRSFLVSGVTLTPGDNVLTAVATDMSGNQGHQSITVHLQAANVARLVTVSGDLQQGVIGSALSQPLVAGVLDAAGQPVAGKPVLFAVHEGSGSFDNGRRQVVVTTGPDGHASVVFKLGSRAGVANQVVEASAPGFAGPTVFHATATAGDAKSILVDSGALQVGVAGQSLPQPLVAVVTDASFNRLPGIDIRLRVIQGGGQFAAGLTEIVATSDSDGRVIVPFTLGSDEGIANNVVEATIATLDPSPKASFVASARVAGDPAATSISGIVLDNVNQPVPGVTLRIKEQPGLTAVADALGLFKLAGAPVGTVHLIVDGSTTARPGSWPDLEFVITTVAGRDNTVNMPIFLLPIDVAHGLLVDETHGGTLILPDFPGFALEVLPGSVTFPGGSRSGVISVTPVHADKVPMVPNFGQQPRFIVTIQPAGARFDPPARLVLPNLEGLAPGAVTEMYSFDHDLGHFVSIGPGTVSPDGLVIASDPGVGVIKAGWHCGGDPEAAGTPADCPLCQICDGNACVPGCALSQPSTVAGNEISAIFAAKGNCTCDDHDDCTINDHCDGHGGCTGDPVTITGIQGNCAAPANTSLSFTAQSNAPSRVRWLVGPPGTPPTGQGGSFSTLWNSVGVKQVVAYCSVTNPQRKDIIIFGKCSDGVSTPTYSFVEPAIPPGSQGYFEGLVNWKAGSCVDGPSDQYCLNVTQYAAVAGYAVLTPAVAPIPVETANDAIVRNDTCAGILANITPIGDGEAGRPPTQIYWSRTITMDHEKKHFEDWKTSVAEPTLAEFKAALAVKCQGCVAPFPKAEVGALFNGIYDPKARQFDKDKERQAYDISNPEYKALANAIRARARQENWRQECR